MRRHYNVLLFVLSFFCCSSALSADFSALKRTGTAEVIEVINPYTVMLSTGKIARLSGLYFTDYTPEDAGPFAQTAVKILKDMLIGQTVSVYQTPKKDWGRTNRMGHELVHLFVEDKKLWVQGALLSLGAAKVQTSKRNPEMATQMLAIETSARKEKTGLWEEHKILNLEEAEDAIGTFQIVEGTIKSPAIKKNRIYLNFGGNWRDDFTVSIAAENKRAFTKNGMNPLDWSNKTVRVRGWIRSYNGPFMEIDHIEAIEFIN